MHHSSIHSFIQKIDTIVLSISNPPFSAPSLSYSDTDSDEDGGGGDNDASGPLFDPFGNNNVVLRKNRSRRKAEQLADPLDARITRGAGGCMDERYGGYKKPVGRLVPFPWQDERGSKVREIFGLRGCGANIEQFRSPQPFFLA